MAAELSVLVDDLVIEFVALRGVLDQLGPAKWSLPTDRGGHRSFPALPRLGMGTGARYRDTCYDNPNDQQSTRSDDDAGHP
jgi:hypothetical protein